MYSNNDSTMDENNVPQGEEQVVTDTPAELASEAAPESAPEVAPEAAVEPEAA